MTAPYKVTIIDNIIVLSFHSKLEAENYVKEVIYAE